MTALQRLAIAELHSLSATGWVRGDYLDATVRRSLSTLIPRGLVAGKQVRAARRTDYRLTDAGRAYVASSTSRFDHITSR